MQATCIEIKELYSELAPYWATIAESISANDLSTEK